MQELEIVREKIQNKYRVVKTDEDLGWNRAIYLCTNIINAHLSRGNTPEFTRSSRDNDGWIPVDERLPEKNEYFVETSSDKDFPNGYYKRLEVAYMTDIIEYVHGYYDGYKWMDKYLDTIENVVAWRIHEPYRPERSNDAKE
ncbi:hypothetical protein [Mordavella massiliensis]|uniref:Uncharacterized protein n=1 Tax=Mordavella massiliensis TaxID=1871024 RepID=A0A938XE17_9CLOT|nr:hypothetical protein [Mordavella massiliensis]MBM6949332.1 hypothetical protein [Mordavella massiliensis]